MLVNQVYPRIPESNWWILRDQFSRAIPNKITVSFLKSLLRLNSEQAARNLLSPLKQLGLINEEGEPTQRILEWVNDTRYADVCKQMIVEVYPEELYSLFRGKDIDRQVVEVWFQHTANLEENAAKKSAAMFTLLNDATPKSSMRFTKESIYVKRNWIGADQVRKDPSLLLEQIISNENLYKAVEKLYHNGHHAQAVEQAFKYLNNLVKQKSGCTDLDGAGLMTTVFSAKSPVLKINAFSTESEKDEQLGYMQIFAGVMTGIRNPRAHEHDWEDTSTRALELLSLANHLVEMVRNSTKATP